VAVASDGDHQGTTVGVRLALRSREPLGPPRQRSPHLRRAQQGGLDRGGDLHRARPPSEPPEAHLDALQLREDLRQSEMLRARDGHGRTFHAAVVEGTHPLAYSLVDHPGAGPGARPAVGEPVLGRGSDQRLTCASRGQGVRVTQGAAVTQFVAVSGAGDEVPGLHVACPLARARQGERAGEVARHVVVAERGHESRSPAGRDGVQLKEDAAGEGPLPRRVEVVRPRPRGSRDRGHSEPHERSDRGDDDIAGLHEARQVGRRGDVDLGHRQVRLEAVGQGLHPGPTPPDQGRLLPSCEQFPEHALPGVPRRTQQHDPALFHGSACLPEGVVTTIARLTSSHSLTQGH
jgi:hypothetical protein